MDINDHKAMKKITINSTRILVGISAIIIAVLLLMILFGQRDWSKNLQRNQFDLVKITDGQTGAKVEVTDLSDIRKIANKFAIKEYRFVHQDKFTGYLHMVYFYLESGLAIRILVLSDRQIAVDGKVYESDQMLDLYCVENLK